MTSPPVIDDVTETAEATRVYDPSNPDAVPALERCFEVQTVAVETATPGEGPGDFVVLQDGDEFLAAADLETLRRAVTFSDAPETGDCALLAAERP